MLSYKEYDNAQAVEIVLEGRVSIEEFEAVANKLEAFIARHGRVRVLEIVRDFEGMDASALWQDIKFGLRHLQDFSRVAIVVTPESTTSGPISSRPSCPVRWSISRPAKRLPRATG